MGHERLTKYVGLNRPFDGAESDDCVNFVNKQNLITGLNWEYAAKGEKYSKGFILADINDSIEFYSENEIE